jgi:hypothetical protein
MGQRMALLATWACSSSSRRGLALLLLALLLVPVPGLPQQQQLV